MGCEVAQLHPVDGSWWYMEGFTGDARGDAALGGLIVDTPRNSLSDGTDIDTTKGA